MGPDLGKGGALMTQAERNSDLRWCAWAKHTEAQYQQHLKHWDELIEDILNLDTEHSETARHPARLDQREVMRLVGVGF